MNLLPHSPLSQSLLPNEPRIADALQQTLTERYLLPVLPALRALLVDLRNLVDPVLASRLPAIDRRPYPHGQGMAITHALHEMLGDPDAGTLPGPAGEGFAALRDFHEHGGSLRQVWGAMNGRHFHHAFLFGTLYADVAADATVPGSDKVTILPFREARLTPVRDHRHFALLARSSWQATVYPNHVLPALAPYAPLIMLMPDGSVRIAPDVAYMSGLALASGFASSADALHGPAMPPDLFALLAGTLREANIAVAPDAAKGRQEALALCVRYRDGRRQPGDVHHVRALDLLAKAGSLLHALHVPAQLQAA